MRTLPVLIVMLVWCTRSTAQESVADSTGLPGDDFSLQGALELFKKAEDLEGFEKALNADENQVNNLDLDNDGTVDYIRVTDHREGDAHAIILQVALSKEETQDVAAVQLEKAGDATAVVQIRGSEELYGTDVFVEPFDEEDVGAATQSGPAPPEVVRIRVWVNVWTWPCVTWIYGPSFVVWNSPWYWGNYPPWWRPWRPMGWNRWHRWHRPYTAWYHHVHTCRVVRANAIYQHRAMHSPRIRMATAPVRQQRTAVRPAREPVMADPNTQQRAKEGRRPAVLDGRERAPRTRPTARTPRTKPAQRAPRTPQPARTPAPSRAPNKR